MVRSFQSGFLCRLVVAFFLAAAVVSAAEIEAQLDRESVAAGNGALLTLKVSGSRAAEPEIPQVDHLIIQQRGRSQQLSIVNGRTSRSVTYQYEVGSHTPGDYQIPAIQVVVDGKKYSTRPLNLKVLDSGAARPPAGMPQAPPGSQSTGGGEADAGEKRFGFLTVEPAANDRKYVYVGEIAPVRIRAWIPDGAQAQLKSGIQPEGKAFTLHNVSDRPQQTREIRDGKPYLVVTWFGGISATKAGKYPASLSVNATVAVRDTSAPRLKRDRSGPFGDPFFDRVFDDMRVPMIQKDVTLKSDDQEIEVRPLPSEGRPDGFTGAVGDFKFDGIEIPADWKTGEPRQIGARLSGSGNFALMKAPEPTPADAWKTYPGKDDFTPGDNASFSGSKSFRFNAVPRKGGDQKLALTFSYFDPARGTYMEIASPAREVHVAGEDMADDEPELASTEPMPVKKEQELVGQHLVMSAPGQLVPLVFRPMFLTLLAAGGGLCVMGGLFALLRRHRADPKRRALEAMDKAVREAQDAAGRCAASGDVPGYFAAARLALQERLGGRWKQPAQAITLAEVSARISDDSPVARFFREADLHAYGRQSGGEILPEWRALFVEAMESLKTSAR